MKKRILSLLMAFVMVLGLLPMNVQAAEKTEVGNQTELAAMSSGSYVLTQDITLENWTTKDFSGTLDGNGHTITLSGATLFGTMSGTVTNLALEGTVTQTGNKNTGALCQNCSGGTIRNCISDVEVTYDGTSSYIYVGQITGTFNSAASISNCLILGSMTPGAASCYGAAGAAMMTSLNISNCVAVGYEQIAMKEGYPDNTVITGTNCTLVAVDSYTPADYLDAFNANRSADDLEWEITEGALQLKEEVAETATAQQMEALGTAIEAAEAVDTTKLYTGNTWSSFAEALAAAQNKALEAAPTASSVETATKALNSAVEGLMQKNTAPVDLSQQEVISITTADELEYMEDEKYYRLDADITLGQYWFGYFNTMNSVLDGNGHTITLIGKPLWSAIGENGVVQNLGILGSAQNSANATGAMAKDCSGLIANCWSKAEVASAGNNGLLVNTGGLVANLKSGGAIVNSWNAGTVTATGTSGSGVKGALAGTTESNTLIGYCYWQEGSLAAAGSGSAQTTGSMAKTAREFGTTEFVALLNSNKGTYGKQWNMSAEGYPWFGEAQNYAPDEPVEITFTSYKGGTTTFMSDEGLILSLSDLDEENAYYAGTLSMEGATGWDDGGSNLIYETNKLYPDNKAASYTVTVHFGENESRTFTIQMVDPTDVVALRLVADDETLVDGSNLTVQGSERIVFQAEVQYEEDGDWERIPTSLLTMSAENGTGEAYVNGAVFYAAAPGTMTITAEGLSKSVSVNVTSEYVPVTAITPAPAGTYVVHDRNANSDDSGEFLDLKLGHSTGNVIITPENASYQGWTLESSDPTVAEYVDAFLKAVLPYKAGTTTLKAISADPNVSVHGTSEITIVYKNPVTAVNFTGTNNTMTVTANQTVDLPLSFTGSQGMDDYHVTEPGMNWSFTSTDGGEVSITRDGLGVIAGTEGSKEYCIANDQYQITGEAPGTVTVTGTPVDTTGGAEAVTFSVVVESGEETPVDVDALVTEAMTGAQNWLKINGASSYGFGDEWELFALTRSGAAIEQNKIDTYLESVKATYQANPLSDTASVSTTIARVAVMLGTLGKDASDFEGIDLIKLLYQDMNAKQTSNAYIWALLAMDSGDYEIPADAVWTREALIEKILTFASENGGFGLTDKTRIDIDMTGMAMQALAPYYSSNNQVKTAVDKSLSYLKGIMTRECDFGSAEATAQVLTALSALEIDPLKQENGFVKSVARNILTGLCKYRSTTGAFVSAAFGSRENKLSTIQALYALESYVRFRDEEHALYDLTDVLIREEPKEPVEPADPAVIAVTISDKGNVVMAQETITVTDRNADGTLSVDEALYAAHEVRYIGGAKAGYGTSMSAYGPGITKLWGVETGSVGYWLNDASCWSLDDPVKAGDYLVAWIYQSPSWEDSYSKLSSIGSTSAVNGTAMKVSLEKAAWDNTAFAYAFSSMPGASFAAYDKNLKKMDVCSVKDQGDGTYEITFDRSGEYYLIATGNADTILVPAVLQVKVTPSGHNPFVDVTSNDYFYEAVLWAVDQKVTTGTSATTFSPANTCTRSQAVTFLWRAAGSPEPEGSRTPFVDVDSNAFYYKAVLWAVENGITTGTSETTFDPEATCTRGQVVTFLWRTLGKVAPASSQHSFTDVNETDYYYEAMLWAVEHGVTTGTTLTTFEPAKECDRGQIVTFLYRALGK